MIQVGWVKSRDWYMNKKEIIENIAHLVGSNVISENAFRTRLRGFCAELDFEESFTASRPDFLLRTGGYLVPNREKVRSTESPIYFLVDDVDCEEYLDVFSRVANLDCYRMFYFRASLDFEGAEYFDILHNGLKIIQPAFDAYEYDQKSNRFIQSDILAIRDCFQYKENYSYSRVSRDKHRLAMDCLEEYSIISLYKLYCSRYVFDAIIGLAARRGISSDIDFIASKNGVDYLIEVKEKDVAKHVNGFGMDLARIKDLLKLQKIYGCEYVYVVRHINNQSERRKIDWKSIRLNAFDEYAVESAVNGGFGMGFKRADYPTRICDLIHFKSMKIKL